MYGSTSRILWVHVQNLAAGLRQASDAAQKIAEIIEAFPQADNDTDALAFKLVVEKYLGQLPKDG